ncbi:MAG: bifunctional serine/threonine-protein kinase/formylglycine-generating enzyme family protein [Planctomycetota bacterium]
MSGDASQQSGPFDLERAIFESLQRAQAGDASGLHELAQTAPLSDAVTASLMILAEDPGNQGALTDLHDLLSEQVMAPGWRHAAAELEPATAALERLQRRTRASDRFEIREEIGRGGMGAVYRAWDRDLRRNCAVKFLERASLDDAGTRHRLERFLEEAQVTGQLEHPGIVPIYEIGIGEEQRLYFVMRLVEGRDLTKLMLLHRAGSKSWSTTRVITVLQGVCETMAYAHARKVVHRDLKPSNIMVGAFAETYVMDWGIARLVGQAAPEQHSSGSTVWTDRVERRHEHGTPFATQEGDVLGTPAYMAPEQARGELDRIGPASDIYSCGAILYETLTGHLPYVDPGTTPSHAEILDRVRREPPTSIDAHKAHAPELVAICQKAMAREPEERYASMRDMAEDLRAYLENRVVRAHRTGAWVEFRKWSRRNRGVAALALVLLLVVIAASSGAALIENRRASETRRNLDELLAADLIRSASTLWPIAPESAPRMTSWLVDADDLLARREPELAAEAARTSFDAEMERRREFMLRLADLLRDQRELVRFAPDWGQATRDACDVDHSRVLMTNLDAFYAGEIDTLQREAATLRQSGSRAASDTRLAAFASDLQTLSALREEVETRRGIAERLKEVSMAGYAEAWSEAIASIADPVASPAYAGLHIEPQLGLVPLWRNDASGLWEFWHVLSGERPERGDDGRPVMRPETGIVLILLPGGTYTVGAQRDDADATNYDVRAGVAERPSRVIELAPYFLAKHELTHEQWRRLSGVMPQTENFPGIKTPGSIQPVTRTHPIEHVSWEDAQSMLGRWSLQLPTMAQWEAAARGGTSTPSWAGAASDALIGHINFLDHSTVGLSTTRRVAREIPEHHDGYTDHAPVDAYSENPYGFCNILGNVWEWTQDWYAPAAQFTSGAQPETGEQIVTLRHSVTCRGGSYETPLQDMRVTAIGKHLPDATGEDIGVRAARALSRTDPSRGRSLR